MSDEPHNREHDITYRKTDNITVLLYTQLLYRFRIRSNRLDCVLLHLSFIA